MGFLVFEASKRYPGRQTRRCKETLRTKLLATVEPYLRNGTTPRGKVKESMDAIHTDVVRDATSRLDPNRILFSRPPRVNKKELRLPRLTRVTLAQLRSGHCARLKDYQFRIGSATDDICPECDLVSHSVPHLFQCPAHPTTLGIKDLWDRPDDVAYFLSSLPSFSFLPPPSSPPPPRRRQRRGRPPSSSSSGDTLFSYLSL